MSELYRDADLDRALVAAAAETDREIAASGASLRVGAAVLARIGARSLRRIPWVAIAATLLIAAGLGSVADLTLVNAADESGQSIVLLDPMVFGPTEVDVQ
jgi:hypothetical protein